MPHPIPYLGFNGNCAEAMRFYERALDGKLETLSAPAGKSKLWTHPTLFQYLKHRIARGIR